jgi:hypothetical protein
MAVVAAISYCDLEGLEEFSLEMTSSLSRAPRPPLRTDEVSERLSQHKADERYRNSSAALCLVDRTLMQEEIYWTSLGGAAVNQSRHPLQPQAELAV